MCASRTRSAAGAGLWCIPCGRPEDDESLREAAARELLEGTGVAATFDHIVHVAPLLHPDKPGTTVWFLADSYMGDPVAGDDAAEAVWFSLDSLPDLAFDDDRLIIDEARTRRLPQAPA